MRIELIELFVTPSRNEQFRADKTGNRNTKTGTRWPHDWFDFGRPKINGTINLPKLRPVGVGVRGVRSVVRVRLKLYLSLRAYKWLDLLQISSVGSRTGAAVRAVVAMVRDVGKSGCTFCANSGGWARREIFFKF